MNTPHEHRMSTSPFSESAAKTRSSSDGLSQSTKMDIDGVNVKGCSLPLSDAPNSRPAKENVARLSVPSRSSSFGP